MMTLDGMTMLDSRKLVYQSPKHFHQTLKNDCAEI